MFKHALMGFGVSLLCLVPPGVHFVTGPLGPMIGGWFAGSRAAASPGQAVAIGLMMGLLEAVPVGVALGVISLMPSVLPGMGGGLLLLIGVGVLVYAALLGSIGALAGGYMVERSERHHRAQVISN